MPNAPQIDLQFDDRHVKGRYNTKEQSVEFTKEILDWVRIKEAEIKKKNKGIKNVQKQIIITKQF